MAFSVCSVFSVANDFMTARLPLAGLKIAVTRPRDQAAPLARRIEQAGGIPVLFPLLEIAAAPDTQALHGQVARLAEADLAIFISPNAVRYGMAAIRAAGVALPAALKIAAVGQGSANALRELGVSGVLAPVDRFDSEALLALPELHDVAGKCVMILRGDGGRELLGDTLKARGARVEYVTCYLRAKPELAIAALLEATPDMLTVTSSEALEHLWQSADGAQRAALREAPLFVPHARIAALAQHQGWRKVHETASGDDGLLAGLIAWAVTRG